MEEEYAIELWLIDANGKNLKPLTDSYHTQIYRGASTSLRWSAIGDKIFYRNSRHTYRFPTDWRLHELVSKNHLPENLVGSEISENGLVAQSVCTIDYYVTPDNFAIKDRYFHELQVTDSWDGEGNPGLGCSNNRLIAEKIENLSSPARSTIH